MTSLGLWFDVCKIVILGSITNTALNSKSNASIIAYYKFDGDLTDSSDNHHDGAINSKGTEQYSLQNVISTESFYFDGNTRIEVESLSSYDWDKTGYLSLSLWIKSLQTDSLTHMELLNNGNYYCTSFQVRIARDDSLQCAVFTQHHENDARGGRPAFGHSFKFDNAWSHNTWHHIVVTYNQYKERKKQLSLYLNGELLGHSEITDKGSGIVTHDHPLYIGHAGSECISNDDYFIGYMDEVMIFESELTQEEITIIYNEGISSKTDNNDEIRNTEMYHTVRGDDDDDDDDVDKEDDAFSTQNHHRYTNHDLAVIIGVALGSIVLILLVLVAYLYWKNKKIHSQFKTVAVANDTENNEMDEGQVITQPDGGTHVRVATMSEIEKPLVD